MFHPQRFHLVRADSIFNVTQTTINLWGIEVQSVPYFSYCALGCRSFSTQNFDLFSRNFQWKISCMINVLLVGLLKLNDWRDCVYVPLSFTFIQLNTVSVFFLFFRIQIRTLREWFLEQSAFCVPHKHMSLNFNSLAIIQLSESVILYIPKKTADKNHLTSIKFILF